MATAWNTLISLALTEWNKNKSSTLNFINTNAVDVESSESFRNFYSDYVRIRTTSYVPDVQICFFLYFFYSYFTSYEPRNERTHSKEITYATHTFNIIKLLHIHILYKVYFVTGEKILFDISPDENAILRCICNLNCIRDGARTKSQWNCSRIRFLNDCVAWVDNVIGPMPVWNIHSWPWLFIHIIITIMRVKEVFQFVFALARCSSFHITFFFCIGYIQIQSRSAIW